MFNHHGKKARQASARLRPETVPSLMERAWRNMAKMLLSKTMKRSLNW